MSNTRRIRVGLVGPLPPPSGGMANQTQQLARLLEQEGLHVELVQVNVPYRPAFVATIRGVRALFRLMPYLWRLWRCAGRVDLLHVMANSGWAWHLFAAPAVWIARVRGTPVIVNYRGGEAETFLQRQHRWVLPTLRRASAVIVPSAFLQRIFHGFCITAEVIPNIINLSKFRPVFERTHGCHIVVTRNLEEIYDIATALRAFAAIKQVQEQATMTVAGSGPQLGDLQQLSAQLGILDAVRFTGRMDNDQIAGLYGNADLMLNPSTVDNMPISLLEAMASGVPIVSTNVGGIPDLVVDGSTALLVRARDPTAMASAALRILSNPKIAADLTCAASACAARYSWSEVAPRLGAVYEQVLGLPSATRCHRTAA